VLSIVAEVSLSDGCRDTALELARACSLAYTAVTPILYKTLTVKEDNYQMVLRIFDDQSPAVIGVLSQPPSQRLCVHVRRVFLLSDEYLITSGLCELRNLSAIYCCTFNHHLFESNEYEQLAQSITQVYALTTEYPTSLPQSVTHVSYYLPVGDHIELSKLKTRVRSLRSSVTHVAVEINESLELEDEDADGHVVTDMLELLQDLLARNSTAPVVLCLYSDAAEHGSVKIISDIISRLESAEARMRVHLWHDERKITNNEDIPTSRRDAIVGRTPWSEATVTFADLIRQSDNETTRPQ